jgi:hypothetical protein
MSRVFQSASKIVLLAFTVTACAALFTKNVSPEIWTGLAGMVFGYYFGRKGDVSGDTMGGK